MQQNPISLAVMAAGGRSKVAQDLGVDPWVVTYWHRESPRIPADMVLELCMRGQNIVKPEVIVNYVAAHRDGKLDAAVVAPLSTYMAAQLNIEREKLMRMMLSYAHDHRVFSKGA